jgi:hypothetical protein
MPFAYVVLSQKCIFLSYEANKRNAKEPEQNLSETQKGELKWPK